MRLPPRSAISIITALTVLSTLLAAWPAVAFSCCCTTTHKTAPKLAASDSDGKHDCCKSSAPECRLHVPREAFSSPQGRLHAPREAFPHAEREDYDGAPAGACCQMNHCGHSCCAVHSEQTSCDQLSCHCDSSPDESPVLPPRTAGENFNPLDVFTATPSLFESCRLANSHKEFVVHCLDNRVPTNLVIVLSRLTC